MKKSNIVTIAIAAACTAVLALATAPAGLAAAYAVLGVGEFDAGMAVEVLAGDDVAAAWAACMGEASAQEGFLPCMAAWTLACALVVALAFLRVVARNPRRDVAGGVLGDAAIIDSPRERSRRNVCWDGRGEAPGASLVFGYEDGKMIGDPDYSHGWVDAKSGAGKSRTLGYPCLYWNVRAGATGVYTARKLTEYKLTAEALESDGVRALLLDLEKPKRGVRLNLMDAVNERVDRGDVAAAQRAARQLAADFVKSDEKNPYFSNAARALLAAAVLTVSMECPERDARNLVSVADTLRVGLTGEGKDPASPLKGYVRSLGQDHPAYKAAAEFLQDNGTTAGRNVVSTLMTAITVLGDEGIEWMLSGSDVTLRQLAEEQYVLMPHCLGEDDPYNVVLSAMYNQLWATLQEVAAEHGERLPRPFVILGDEWGNLPRVECLGEMVSLGRSMDLHVFVFVQNMSQLEKYNDPGDNGAGMDKLLGSMNLQVAMSVMKARPDGEYFSSLCGKRTVRARTQGTSVQGAGLGSRGGSSDSLAEQAVDLLPPSSFKDRVPLRDGIVVVKGGENGAPGREGVFNVPIADATRIKSVREYFGLGTKEEDRAKCERMEAALERRAEAADARIPRWTPDFDAAKGDGAAASEIEDDEWRQWD